MNAIQAQLRAAAGQSLDDDDDDEDDDESKAGYARSKGGRRGRRGSKPGAPADSNSGPVSDAEMMRRLHILTGFDIELAFAAPIDDYDEQLAHIQQQDSTADGAIASSATRRVAPSSQLPWRLQPELAGAAVIRRGSNATRRGGGAGSRASGKGSTEDLEWLEALARGWRPEDAAADVDGSAWAAAVESAAADAVGGGRRWTPRALAAHLRSVFTIPKPSSDGTAVGIESVNNSDGRNGRIAVGAGGNIDDLLFGDGKASNDGSSAAGEGGIESSESVALKRSSMVRNDPLLRELASGLGVNAVTTGYSSTKSLGGARTNGEGDDDDDGPELEGDFLLARSAAQRAAARRDRELFTAVVGDSELRALLAQVLQDELQPQLLDAPMMAASATGHPRHALGDADAAAADGDASAAAGEAAVAVDGDGGDLTGNGGAHSGGARGRRRRALAAMRPPGVSEEAWEASLEQLLFLLEAAGAVERDPKHKGSLRARDGDDALAATLRAVLGGSEDGDNHDGDESDDTAIRRLLSLGDGSDDEDAVAAAAEGVLRGEGVEDPTVQLAVALAAGRGGRAVALPFFSPDAVVALMKLEGASRATEDDAANAHLAAARHRILRSVAADGATAAATARASVADGSPVQSTQPPLMKRGSIAAASAFVLSNDSSQSQAALSLSRRASIAMLDSIAHSEADEAYPATHYASGFFTTPPRGTCATGVDSPSLATPLGFADGARMKTSVVPVRDKRGRVVATVGKAAVARRLLGTVDWAAASPADTPAVALGKRARATIPAVTLARAALQDVRAAEAAGPEKPADTARKLLTPWRGAGMHRAPAAIVPGRVPLDGVREALHARGGASALAAVAAAAVEEHLLQSNCVNQIGRAHV